MRWKRTKAFIIDFIILFIVFNILNLVIPKDYNIKDLEARQNELIEKYTNHEILFEEYYKEYSITYYELMDKQKILNISYLLFILIYFILLPFLWKGRTFGCFLNNIQVERFDKGKLMIHQLLIRNIFVIGLLYLIVLNIGIFCIPSTHYFLIVSIVGILQMVLAIFCFNMVFFTKAKRGLQDILSNTEMVKII